MVASRRRRLRNSTSAGRQVLKNAQKLNGEASVRPNERVYVIATGSRRFGVSRVMPTLAPISCRRYTLNSDRRSAYVEKMSVLLADRNAGRRTAAVRL